MPRWRFRPDLVLGSDWIVHRRDCKHAPPAEREIAIGPEEEITCRLAPDECGTCEPRLLMLISPADPEHPPRSLDDHAPERRPARHRRS